MENLVEGQFGHGGIQDSRDIRDYLYKDIAEALSPFDWNTPFDIESIIGKLPVKNQEQTYSCGGFAWASYSYVLDPTNREEKSEKFIYAHTNVPPGGSDGRTNCDFCVKKGICAKSLCPLPNPLTEAEITRTDDITAEAYANALTNKEKTYLAVYTDIDSVAQAIRDNNGVVLGITGSNNGTWLSKFPSPVIANKMWNHWVYAGKILMIDGKKYIGFLNSWGETVGENGWQYITEDYFKGMVWSCWTMVYNSDIKFTFTKTLKLGSTGLDVKMLQTRIGAVADGIFGKHTKDAVIMYQLQHGLVGDGIVGPKTNAVLNA